jgi:ribonuclease P protein component
MQNRLEYKKRLTKKKQIERLFSRAGQKLFTKYFSVYYCNNYLGYSRLGIIVPKKNIHKSTRRNCIKRIVREFFRLNQYQFKSTDLLIVINKWTELLTNNELNQKLVKYKLWGKRSFSLL